MNKKTKNKRKYKKIKITLSLLFFAMFFIDSSYVLASTAQERCTANGKGKWTAGLFFGSSNGTCTCNSGTLSQAGFCGGETMTDAERNCYVSGGTLRGGLCSCPSPLVTNAASNICQTSTDFNVSNQTNQYPDPSSESSGSTNSGGPFTYKLMEGLPGFFAAGTNAPSLPALILGLYKFGIWTIGIAGLLMITVGGFMYTASAGNTSQADTAKGIIKDSLIGIVAAMAAYLFLFIINPDLVKINLNLIKLSLPSTTAPSAAPVATTTAVGGTCSANATSSGCCKTGTNCTTCSNCVSFSNDYARLCFNGSTQTVGNTGCMLNTTLASKLNNANLNSVNAEVSEAWPPTVTHTSPCHKDGTCADVRCKAQCDNLSVPQLKAIYTALENAGLRPLFETKKDCASYKAAGITNCAYYSTMTSPSSFHVNL